MVPSQYGNKAVLLLVAVVGYVLGVVIGRESGNTPSDGSGRSGTAASRPTRSASSPPVLDTGERRKAREKERGRGLKIASKQSRKVAKYAKKSRAKKSRAS